MAMARVPLAMPERSIGRKSGSICTTTMEPGGLGLWRDINGWSIQPPASCRRLGMAPSNLATGVVFIKTEMGVASAFIISIETANAKCLLLTDTCLLLAFPGGRDVNHRWTQMDTNEETIQGSENRRANQ